MVEGCGDMVVPSFARENLFSLTDYDRIVAAACHIDGESATVVAVVSSPSSSDVEQYCRRVGTGTGTSMNPACRTEQHGRLVFW